MWIVGPLLIYFPGQISQIHNQYDICVTEEQLQNKIIQAQKANLNKKNKIVYMKIADNYEFDIISRNGITEKNYKPPHNNIEENNKKQTLKKKSEVKSSVVVEEIEHEKDPMKQLFYHGISLISKDFKNQLLLQLPNLDRKHWVVKKPHFLAGLFWKTIIDKKRTFNLQYAYFVKPQPYLESDDVFIDFRKPYLESNNNTIDDKMFVVDKKMMRVFQEEEFCLWGLIALVRNICDRIKNMVTTTIVLKHQKRKHVIVYVKELHSCLKPDYKPSTTLAALLYYRYCLYLSFQPPMAFKFLVCNGLNTVMNSFVTKTEDYLITKSIEHGIPPNILLNSSNVTDYDYYTPFSFHLTHFEPPKLMSSAIYQGKEQYRWLLRVVSVSNGILSLVLSKFRDDYSPTFSTSLFSLIGTNENLVVTDDDLLQSKKKLMFKTSTKIYAFTSLSTKSQWFTRNKVLYRDENLSATQKIKRRTIEDEFDVEAVKVRLISRVLEFRRYLFLFDDDLDMEMWSKNKKKHQDNVIPPQKITMRPTLDEVMSLPVVGLLDETKIKPLLSNRREMLKQWMGAEKWSQRLICCDLFFLLEKSRSK